MITEITEEILDKKATFMFKRERVGYSRSAFAEAFGITDRSVKRWESATALYAPNDEAIQMLDDLNDLHDEQVAKAIASVVANAKALGEKPIVDLYYYPSQSIYEAWHPEENGYFGFPNAITREVHDSLKELGFTIRIHARTK